MRPVAVPTDEHGLIARLRAGDEAAFVDVHDRYHARLVALAMTRGCTRAGAEEVAQETWAAVVHGIDSFQGRSSLKTWIFRILVNNAHAHAKRERRLAPLSERNVIDLEEARGRRLAAPEERLLSKETTGRLQAAIERLPEAQRAVITLRDLRGWSAEETCAHLGITDANQRVLLHRARLQVRSSLADYLELGEARRAA